MCQVKGELFYPVHACVLGGSLKALRWLVDDNCCPIKSVRVSGKTKDNASKYTAIVTSRGRSLLSIAMETNNTEIVRYLVVEKRLSIATDKGITPAMLIRNLDLALRLIPGDSSEGDDINDNNDDNDDDVTVEAEVEIQSPAPFSPDYMETPPPVPISERTGSSVSMAETNSSLNEIARNFGAIGGGQQDDNDCIICFDAKIE